MASLLSVLDSAREKALDKPLALRKEVVCRVPSTQQRLTLSKDQVCRVSNNNTRQRVAAVNGQQPSLIFCRVSSADTQQRGSFAECHFLTLGKPYFFSLLTSKLFLQSSYNTWYSMFQCGTFLGLFLYFFNLFNLIEFSWIIQIITASHSNNEKNEWKNDIHVI